MPLNFVKPVSLLDKTITINTAVDYTFPSTLQNKDLYIEVSEKLNNQWISKKLAFDLYNTKLWKSINLLNIRINAIYSDFNERILCNYNLISEISSVLLSQYMSCASDLSELVISCYKNEMSSIELLSVALSNEIDNRNASDLNIEKNYKDADTMICSDFKRDDKEILTYLTEELITVSSNIIGNLTDVSNSITTTLTNVSNNISNYIYENCLEGSKEWKNKVLTQLTIETCATFNNNVSFDKEVNIIDKASFNAAASFDAAVDFKNDICVSGEAAFENTIDGKIVSAEVADLAIAAYWS